jgi:hypothetical protein
MTKPTGKPRGPRPRQGPRLQKRPAHRPTPEFWRDPARVHFALALAWVSGGQSMRRALSKAAIGQRLFPVIPGRADLAKINGQRQRALRKKSPDPDPLSTLLGVTPRPGDLSIANRIRGWEIKLKAYRRDPVVDAWLSLMAGYLYSRLQQWPPPSATEVTAAAARFEALVKNAPDRITA